MSFSTYSCGRGCGDCGWHRRRNSCGYCSRHRSWYRGGSLCRIGSRGFSRSRRVILGFRPLLFQGGNDGAPFNHSPTDGTDLIPGIAVLRFRGSPIAGQVGVCTVNIDMFMKSEGDPGHQGQNQERNQKAFLHCRTRTFQQRFGK